MRHLLFVAIMAFCAQMCTEARVVSGNTGVTKTDIVFLDRFVFNPVSESVFRYEFNFTKPLGLYRLAMFEKNWRDVRDNEDQLTCSEKLEAASIVTTLTPEATGACSSSSTEDGKDYIHCQGQRDWEDYPNARWWYITLVNCNDDGFNNLAYNITMLNGNHKLNKHFSAEEQNTLQTNVGFGAGYILMFLWATISRSILKKQRLLHNTFNLFYVSIACQMISLICSITAKLAYAENGVNDKQGVEVAGHVLSSIGTLLFVVNLMLIGKGYTVTRARISTAGSIKLTVFTMLYASAYGVLYFYKEVLVDPRDAAQAHGSPVGLGLVAMRFIGAIWLLYTVVITLIHFPRKKKFYLPFLMLFTVWFLAEPAIVLVTNYVVESYQREKWVNGIHWAVEFAGHYTWLVLTTPHESNRIFPYRMRCNQVGILPVHDNDDDTIGYAATNKELSDLHTIEAVIKPAYYDMFLAGGALPITKLDQPDRKTAWVEIALEEPK